MGWPNNLPEFVYYKQLCYVRRTMSILYGKITMWGIFVSKLPKTHMLLQHWRYDIYATQKVSEQIIYVFIIKIYLMAIQKVYKIFERILIFQWSVMRVRSM